MTMREPMSGRQGVIDTETAAARLRQRREEIEAASARTAEGRRPVALDQQSVGRLSRMDALQQQAMDETTERTRRRDLLRIERAQARLRDGEYGWCEECGEEIAARRLEVDPMAERCVRCAA